MLDLKSLMLLQIVLEGCLVLLLVVLLWRSRRRPGAGGGVALPEGLREGVERFLAESEKISATFQANLKDKKDLSQDLILKLDRRLADYRQLLEATEEAVRGAEERLSRLGGEMGAKAWAQAAPLGQPKSNPAAPEVRAMVLQLAKKGLSVEDIAVKAKLHRGEVELIIDLEHQFSV
ncbi:MAG: hypothetical protein LBL95_10145 [Deltaproteobacteria bacterium]|nr:hypothetical protein [Deltaproteobacteria bacterium]